MLTIIRKIELTPINKLHTIIVLLAILLTTQIQYIQHGWINPDSILYFESARLFTEGQWKEALRIWNWPLYPVLITVIHKITGLAIQTSAQVLNVLFFGIATFSFINIIRLAGGSQLTMAAGALILFSSQYIVGDVLGMLMRDEGFWAFYLTGLAFFIRFYQHLRFRDAMLWQLCAIIATLFRIEGITYLILMPALFFFNFNLTVKERIRYFFISHTLNIILASGLILVIALHGDLSIKSFGRLHEVFSLNLYNELTHKLFTKAQIMSDVVLGKYLQDFAVQGLLLTFIYVIVSKIISVTGLVGTILSGFAFKNKSLPIEQKAYSVIRIAIAISLINMALIIVKVFVLSGRYIIPLACLLLILAAFMLASLTQKISTIESKKSTKKLAYIALIIFLLLSVVKNIIPKQAGYNYQQDAMTWLQTYNTSHENVFIDDSRLRYYAGQPFKSQKSNFSGSNFSALKKSFNDKSIYENSILVISSTRQDTKSESFIAEKLPEYREIKRFSNGRKANKYVVIYSLQEDVEGQPPN